MVSKNHSKKSIQNPENYPVRIRMGNGLDDKEQFVIIVLDYAKINNTKNFSSDLDNILNDIIQNLNMKNIPYFATNNINQN